MFVLAHLSDPHLPLPPPGPTQLLSKRFTGYVSWQTKRRHIHVPRALQAVTDDIRARTPDHIALTGDIANISLPEEFTRAAAWLASFAPPQHLTVVPGNHDLYVSVPWPATLGLWASYMQGDDGVPADSRDAFPFVRRRGEIALIGLSTAIPTWPLLARGALGQPQIERLGTILAALADEDVCRVVLIHHPPHVDGAPWRKELADGAALRRCLLRHGADLVLHGHNHRNEIGRIDGPDGAIPVLGVISASAAPDSPYGRGGWNAISIGRASGAWNFSIEHRAVNDDGVSCAPQSTFEVVGPVLRARASTVYVHQDAATAADAARA